MSIHHSYKYEWALFADWCIALDCPALPASPMTLARFLDAHPAARSTQLRRIAAINHTHQAAGHSAPGHAQAIRGLYSARARARSRRAATALEVIKALPDRGWPSGLFGRRDALLLQLTCVTGISVADIGRIQRSDLTYRDRSVTIGGGHDVVLEANPEDPAVCPVAIYLRWARLQVFQDRYPSNWALAQALTNNRPDSEDNLRVYRQLPALHGRHDGPLLPSFDQWGHPAMLRRDRRGLSERAVIAIAEAHLSGAPSRHRREREEDLVSIEEASPNADFEPAANSDASEVAEFPTGAELQARYDKGLAARYSAADRFREVDDVFADLDQKADELLKRTELLLAQATSE